jgi:hypothetical protein
MSSTKMVVERVIAISLCCQHLSLGISFKKYPRWQESKGQHLARWSLPNVLRHPWGAKLEAWIEQPRCSQHPSPLLSFTMNKDCVILKTDACAKGVSDSWAFPGIRSDKGVKHERKVAHLLDLYGCLSTCDSRTVEEEETQSKNETRA